MTHELGEIVITTIEFVVSQDEGIETELVDGLGDLFTTVVREIQGSLRATRQEVTERIKTGPRTWNSSPMLRNRLFCFCGLK